MDDHAPLTCPSAQPDMVDARVFALVAGSADRPQLAYLKAGVNLDPATVSALGETARHALRYAARCENSGCSHHDGQRCGLGRRITQQLDAVVDALPLCQIRPSCRWYRENGREACLRCPQVVTYVPEHSGRLSQAARIAVVTV